MYTPTTICIDTNIYDKANYNFHTEKMNALRKTLSNTEITLLEPNPISREIYRHIIERAQQATTQTFNIFNKFPYSPILALSPKEKTQSLFQMRIKNDIQDSFNRFHSAMKKIQLDYSGIDINMVMDWYDNGIAPFSPKKKKEFPDAFSIAILDEYSIANNDIIIAVISSDSDIKNACDIRKHLLHFESLELYANTLLNHDETYDKINTCVSKNVSIIIDTIKDHIECLEIEFDHPYIYPAGEFTLFEIKDYSNFHYDIISISNNECSIAFEWEFDYEIDYHINDCCEDGPIRGTESFSNTISFYGCLKVSFEKSYSELSVTLIDIDNKEFTVETPEEYRYFDF